MEIYENEVHYVETGATARYTVVRVPSEQDRRVVRIWTDEAGNFCTAELQVEFVDYATPQDPADTDRFAPQDLVHWDGKLVHPVAGATGAHWATDDEHEDRRDRVEGYRDMWEAYRLESAELRAEWTFTQYVFEDHLLDNDAHPDEDA